MGGNGSMHAWRIVPVTTSPTLGIRSHEEGEDCVLDYRLHQPQHRAYSGELLTSFMHVQTSMHIQLD